MIIPNNNRKLFSLWWFAFIIVALAFVIGVTLLNPLWLQLNPTMFPASIQPPITAPIDGLYYILNAQFGYRWNTHDPLSLWFHPLLAWILKTLPQWLAPNYWFFILSALFAVICLPLVYQFAFLISQDKDLPTRYLPMCLLVPGGLVLATGNAEIPVLCFELLLLLSVLVWHKWWLTIPFALLAILTKPNSLYMVPILLTYFWFAMERRSTQVWVHALLGIVALLIGWSMWSWIIDWKTGLTGGYWKIRIMEPYYLDIASGNFYSFFRELARSYYDHDIRNIVRYSTAVLIPIVNFLIIGLVPLSDEIHRYAMAAGNLAMMVVMLFLGNPNKIILYTTTLPGYFALNLLLINFLKSKLVKSSKLMDYMMAIGYSIYCLLMILVFIVGMPFGWYH